MQEKKTAVKGTGQPVGRPPLFRTPEAMEKRIQEYFDRPDKKPTLAGLALFLGFQSRESMYDYEKRSEEFSYIVKKARLAIEAYYEELLVNPDIRPAGVIFALKQQGWRDRQEVVGDGGGPLRLVVEYV